MNQRMYMWLLHHFRNRKKPIRFGAALFGLVRVNLDLYGYEVSIGFNRELLDCNPDSYGLSRDEAMSLFEAILSCVPNTTTYKFRRV